MKTPISPKSVRRAALVACAILAPFAAGQVGAAPAGANPSDNSVSSEAGTIPAARQLPPQSSRGAEGPIRSDPRNQAYSDPSLRDSNLLTVNGLWETLPGNRVAKPNP